MMLCTFCLSPEGNFSSMNRSVKIFKVAQVIHFNPLDEQKKVLKGKMLAKHCLEIFDQYMCIAKMQSVLCEICFHTIFFSFSILFLHEWRHGFFCLPMQSFLFKIRISLMQMCNFVISGISHMISRQFMFI